VVLGQGPTTSGRARVQWAGSDGVPPPPTCKVTRARCSTSRNVGGAITGSTKPLGVDKLPDSRPDTIAGWDLIGFDQDRTGRRRSRPTTLTPTLPSTAITVRATGPMIPGTTSELHEVTDQAGRDTWKLGTDKTVAWAVGSEGRDGNAGRRPDREGYETRATG